MIRRLAVVASLLAALLTAAGTTSADARVVADSKVNATRQLLRNDTGLYPRAVRLQHSGAANGRVLASVVTFVGNADGIGASYESRDGGGTFAQVGTVADPSASGGQGLCASARPITGPPRQVDGCQSARAE
jgi:hypothetical protein